MFRLHDSPRNRPMGRAGFAKCKQSRVHVENRSIIQRFDRKARIRTFRASRRRDRRLLGLQSQFPVATECQQHAGLHGGARADRSRHDAAHDIGRIRPVRRLGLRLLAGPDVDAFQRRRHLARGRLRRRAARRRPDRAGQRLVRYAVEDTVLPSDARHAACRPRNRAVHHRRLPAADLERRRQLACRNPCRRFLHRAVPHLHVAVLVHRRGDRARLPADAKPDRQLDPGRRRQSQAPQARAASRSAASRSACSYSRR